VTAVGVRQSRPDPPARVEAARPANGPHRLGCQALKRVLVVACALAAASAPASAAVKPDALASTGGGGVASVSGGPWSGWRVVVTTKPSGLSVLLKIRGQKKLIAKSPIVRRASCHPSCKISVSAQLSAEGRSHDATGTVSLALYHEPN
jgi:hypothetical protein